MHHGMFRLFPIELHFQQLVLHRVAAFLRDAGYRASGSWWQQDFVIVHQTVLIDGAKHIAPGDMISNLEIPGGKIPFSFTV